VAAAGLFALSRAAYCAAGVRFNDGPLGAYWQYLDPFLLRRRLLESLLALHAQPPLFNLYLGLALKTGHERVVFSATFVLAGLALYLGSFLLMRRLSVSPLLAFLLATWMATSPAFVAYENWLFYPLPVAALLVLAALAFERAARGGRLADGFAFLALLTLVSLARSLYHLVFLLAAAVLLAVAWRDPGKALRAAVAPLALVVLVYAKNAVMFGAFAPSTWTGMNLARLTTEALGRAEASSLVQAGTLHPAALVPAFSRPEDYPRAYFESLPPTRVRALYWPVKTTGAVNFNHAAYIAISRDLLADARWVIVHRPATYLGAVAGAWGIYFRSPSDLRFLGLANLAILRPAMDLYDTVFFGRWPGGRGAEEPAAPRRYWGLMVVLPLVFLAGVAAAFGRGPGRALDRPQRSLTAFLAGTIGYVALVGNLLELGENNRFRFETDPLSVCLLGLALTGAARAVRRRRPPVLESGR